MMANGPAPPKQAEMFAVMVFAVTVGRADPVAPGTTPPIWIALCSLKGTSRYCAAAGRLADRQSAPTTSGKKRTLFTGDSPSSTAILGAAGEDRDQSVRVGRDGGF
jgi:hypothetical protein